MCRGGLWWSHVPHPPISRASLLTETVLSAQAGESRPRRSLYTLLSMIAAIKQPAVLLAVKDHLCTPPSQCTTSLYLSHTVCAQKTHAWHFALCVANIQPDRAGKLSVPKASYDKDRHMILEQERESIFPLRLIFIASQKETRSKGHKKKSIFHQQNTDTNQRNRKLCDFGQKQCFPTGFLEVLRVYIRGVKSA